MTVQLLIFAAAALPLHCAAALSCCLHGHSKVEEDDREACAEACYNHETCTFAALFLGECGLYDDEDDLARLGRDWSDIIDDIDCPWSAEYSYESSDSSGVCEFSAFTGSPPTAEPLDSYEAEDEEDCAEICDMTDDCAFASLEGDNCRLYDDPLDMLGLYGGEGALIIMNIDCELEVIVD